MPTYTVTTLSKDESIDYQMSVLSSCGISMISEDCKFLWLYWVPKLHQCPCKQRYIAGGAKYSAKPLSNILTSIFTGDFEI
jgi:hypothetical protein